MFKKALFLTLATAVSVSLVLAYAPSQGDYKGKPMTPERIIGPRDLPSPDGFAPAYKPYEPTDPIGDVFIFGNTWYDTQHNGTCGRQLNVESNGWVHLTWMNGLNSGASQRHIYYQLMDSNDNLMFTTPTLGVQVDQVPRSGYTTSVVYPGGTSLPVFHQGMGGEENFHTAIAHDYFPHVGAFMATELPWVWEGGVDLEVIWPRSAIDINNRIHIVSTENPAGVVGDLQRHYYGWAEYDPASHMMTTCTAQEYMTWTMVIASDVAASPVSDRVAIGWMQMAATGDTNQYDNDLILCISNNGLTWDWTDTINVTNWIPPDTTLLPDTALADRDTLRCYTDMNLIFDNDDVLHAFFSTRGYYSLEGTLAWGNGFIWHWDEINQVFSMVANGWYENGFYSPGAWNIYIQRPSAAVDPATGDIYCMYQRYFNFTDSTTFMVYSDTLDFPYLQGDTADWSFVGWPNGEIWVTKSTDGGVSWSEGINVTNTHSPNAPAGQCLSELTPCMAEQIYNDQLHIFYILDRDAGAVVHAEGDWTLNDAVYQRIPLSEIPAGPVLPPYPMHCDSTGMPSLPGLNVEVNLTPYNPPIIIPVSGGTFEFNIAVTNNEPEPATFDVWTMATLPDGREYGPIIGPINLTLNPGASIDRDRSQSVPGGIPSGNYTYDAYVGNYPSAIYDEDHFDFTKLAEDNGGPLVPEWANWGESFEDSEASVLSTTPTEFSLHPAHPNPFNPSTAIRFELRDASFVKLAVYDVSGREVVRLVDDWRFAGKHEITFDGSGLSSGVYFARLIADGFSQTRKLLLIK